jgi:hypothetical protein
LKEDALAPTIWSIRPGIGYGRCVIAGFFLEADKNCTLLSCYAASSGDFLPTSWILDP